MDITPPPHALARLARALASISSYAIGVAEPVSVYVETFGTEHQDAEFINQFVRENYDLTPRSIIENLGLLDVDYNKVSAYGHFGKFGLPWEC